MTPWKLISIRFLSALKADDLVCLATVEAAARVQAAYMDGDSTLPVEAYDPGDIDPATGAIRQEPDASGALFPIKPFFVQPRRETVLYPMFMEVETLSELHAVLRRAGVLPPVEPKKLPSLVSINGAKVAVVGASVRASVGAKGGKK